ncbi:MAG: hypothetical protein JXA69_09640 [Phycisphaerae bacterium]|nr:hypothetical protein [Phycisphaerae bacterium]
MRTGLFVLCVLVAAHVGVGVAHADIHTFQPNPADLYDLDHARAYA